MIKHDLDIVSLIQREQMNNVNRQVLFTQNERFLLQFQRRNVIASNSDSAQDNQRQWENKKWKNLIKEEGSVEFEKMMKEMFEKL